jgi:hypothetical protein
MDQKMYEYIYDMTETRLVPFAGRILELMVGMGFSPRTIENTIVTSSSGISITVIPIDGNIVFQGYINETIFHRIKDFCTLLARHRDRDEIKFLTPCHEFYPEINAISFKKSCH